MITTKNKLSLIKNNQTDKTKSLKKEALNELLLDLGKKYKPDFISFLEECNSYMEVVCQAGDPKIIDNLNEKFNLETARKIIDLIFAKRDILGLSVDGEYYLFIPIVSEEIRNKKLIFMSFNKQPLFSKKTLDEITKKIYSSVNQVSHPDFNKYVVESFSGKEVFSPSDLKTILNKNNLSNNILFKVFEDKNSLNNYWQILDIDLENTLIFVSEIKENTKLLNFFLGYIEGLISNIKDDSYSNKTPSAILNYLNIKLHNAYRQASFKMSAVCAVFNKNTRELQYCSSNFLSPYLLGPEQQIIRLQSKEQPHIGENLLSSYTDFKIFIPVGSKLVIFNSSAIESISKIGSSYDHEWINEYLEVTSALSLSQMYDAISKVLSENESGTAHTASRLAIMTSF